jgi:hypothetical protein
MGDENSVDTVMRTSVAKSPRRLPMKDHLQSQAGQLTQVGKQAADLNQTDPLVFWTIHLNKPYLVDLREFAVGTLEQGGAEVRFGPRRALIEQIAPAFRVKHAMSAPRTIETLKTGLRKWWRLFDAIESEEAKKLPDGAMAKRLTSVLDLGALHGSRAVQSGMSINNFHSFVALADLTRRALGLQRPLHWPAPAKRKRQLAVVLPRDDIKALYHGMKADWHGALDRWSLTKALIAGQSRTDCPSDEAGDSPTADGCTAIQSEDASVLLTGLRLWHQAVHRLGHVDLVRQDLVDSAGTSAVPLKALNISEVAEAMYPNAYDIRSAFHLCMAVGGLNAAVLTDLQLDLPEDLGLPQAIFGGVANDQERQQWVLQHCPFLILSPIDGEYYIEGWKDRAKSWVSRTYKWKQHLTPGPILVELIIRTWPLRVVINGWLTAANLELTSAVERGASPDEVNALQSKVFELMRGVRSVWLYRSMQGITWLEGNTYHTVAPKQSYIQWVTHRLNERRRARQEPEIAPMEPRRFRDAYAAWALEYSGSDVLAVMVALDHKHLESTDGYLENTAVRARIVKKQKLFAKALFGSLVSGKVDPTMLAMETRFAGKGLEERTRMAIRLVEYREAVKSRYGVGCRDPHHPSPLVDPAFNADGTNTCTAHRCTLCPENAIITPDAYPGLMLRQAELEIREENMPMASFVLSTYDAELQKVRTSLAPLRAADPERVTTTVESLKREMRAGERRVPGFSVKPS